MTVFNKIVVYNLSIKHIRIKTGTWWLLPSLLPAFLYFSSTLHLSNKRKVFWNSNKMKTHNIVFSIASLVGLTSIALAFVILYKVSFGRPSVKIDDPQMVKYQNELELIKNITLGFLGLTVVLFGVYFYGRYFDMVLLFSIRAYWNFYSLSLPLSPVNSLRMLLRYFRNPFIFDT